MESKSKVTNEFIYETEVESYMYKTNLQMPGDGRGGINWEIGINICTTIYKIGTPQAVEWERTCLPSRRHRVDPCVMKIPGRRGWLPTPVFTWRIPWREEHGRL